MAEQLLTQGSLPNSYPRALRVEPCCNVHGSQLLEEKFGCVGDVDLGDLRFVVTGSALKRIFLEVASLLLAQKLGNCILP